MRDETTFGKRKAKSESLQIKKKYILFFEGIVTEVEYFNGVKNNSRKLGINKLIDIRVMQREKKDVMRSNILTMINDIKNVKENKCNKEPFEDVNFEKGDELWIIFDRDSLPLDQIEKAIDYQEKEFNHYLGFTNPCFELWLLLHIKDITAYPNEIRNEIFANNKVTNKYGYIGKILSDYSSDALFKKKHIKFSFYIDKISKAIENERKIENEVNKIKESIGSNIGLLMASILEG